MKHFKIFFSSIFLLLLLESKAQLTFPHLAVLYDSAWTYKNLQLIPIRFADSLHYDATFPKSFVLLSNAIKSKKVQIKENNFEGRSNVNVLNLLNTSKEHILVESGDLLKGGKQDRMFAETKFIEPNKEVDFLSVYCIEKGRWDKKAKPFTYGGYAGVDVRKSGDSMGGQQHVWKEIEKEFAAEKVTSETFPYLQVKQKKTALPDYVTFFRNRFAQSDSLYAGFIVVSDSAIIGCDVFANEKLLVASFDNLISSYADGVKQPDKSVTDVAKMVKVFAGKLFSTEFSQKKFLEQHGKMFMYKNKPLHITAYGN